MNKYVSIISTYFNYIFRKCAIEALISLMQIHDKADLNDIVLRDQISQLVFVTLPQISAVLINVCQEETLRGKSLVQVATNALGRFLCLVFEDYEKTSEKCITNKDFMSLIKTLDVLNDENILQPKNIMNLKKSREWLQAASKKLQPALLRLNNLRGSEHQSIRNELAVFSWSLLQKCLPNIQCFAPFLLENLVLFTDDSDQQIREFSQTSLRRLTNFLPDLNQKIAELFMSHLTVMPRIILTGDESEQIAGFTLLNSLVRTITDEKVQLNSFLDNPVVLEKFLNVMLSCCEIDVPSDFLFYENLASGSLDDQFYQMKMPWKQFRNLKNEFIIKKFSQVCHNVGSSSAAQLCVNHLLDNMNSIEYLVLIIEILDSGPQTTLAKDQVEGIVEEFLNESYWTMKVHGVKAIESSQRSANEQWYEDHTQGLYESAIEIRLRDVKPEDEHNEAHDISLKTIKYNILCTCLVVELMGVAAKVLKMNFQRFMLRVLHLVLEKAGSSNFIIRSAGLYALELISTSMGFNDVAQLIDENSDFLLFNIEKMLKRSHQNELIFDMLSVIFKFTKASMTSYIKDIVETAAENITSNKISKNISGYLKLFRLYVGFIKQRELENELVMDETEMEVTQNWDEFLQQCLFDLEKPSEDVNETCPLKDVTDEDQEMITEELPTEDQQEVNENQTPPHVELIIKILSSTVQFFASSNPSEVILTHEIFTDSLPILHRYEDQFLPMIHQMWYPFTKQFQVKNLVVLQHSFRLMTLIAHFAKDFVHKRSTEDVIPVINKFLLQSAASSASKVNLSYMQEFKLQREILSSYGALAVDLDIDEKGLDVIIDILLKYDKHANEQLASASKRSLEVLRKHNPGLVCYKMKF